MRRWIKFCLLPVLVLAIIIYNWRPRQALEFEILDYVTGKPIQNATVEISQRRTRFPVEKIPFFAIDPNYRRIIVAKAGLVEVPGFWRNSLSCPIVVQANGYAEAFVDRVSPDESTKPDLFRITYFGEPWLHDSPYEYVDQRSRFTIALEPLAGGTNRAGAKYVAAPSPGSREKAFDTATREAAKSGWNPSNIKVEWAKFRNGHWEIRLSELSRVGGYTQFDIADNAELLGIHPGE